MNGSCERCGNPLAPGQPDFHSLCWRCWRQENRPARQAPEFDHVSFARGFSAGYSAGRENVIDPDLIIAAIRLCHPDAHPTERFEVANRVTARLLEFRDHEAA